MCVDHSIALRTVVRNTCREENAPRRANLNSHLSHVIINNKISGQESVDDLCVVLYYMLKKKRRTSLTTHTVIKIAGP